MKTEFRNRAFLPVMMPLALVGFIALVVGLFALILLYNTRDAALVLALVGAGGVLFAIALASSRDSLNGLQKGVLLIAGVVPVALGGVFALGLGDVPDEDLNINRQPHIIAATLEGSEAVVIATEFAFDPDAGSLDAGEITWTINNEGAALHNIQIDGHEDALKVEANGGESATGTITLEAGDYVFYCSVPGHRTQGMEGTFTVT